MRFFVLNVTSEQRGAVAAFAESYLLSMRESAMKKFLAISDCLRNIFPESEAGCYGRGQYASGAMCVGSLDSDGFEFNRMRPGK